jgi:hypothetical protein
VQGGSPGRRRREAWSGHHDAGVAWLSARTDACLTRLHGEGGSWVAGVGEARLGTGGSRRRARRCRGRRQLGRHGAVATGRLRGAVVHGASSSGRRHRPARSSEQLRLDDGTVGMEETPAWWHSPVVAALAELGRRRRDAWSSDTELGSSELGMVWKEMAPVRGETKEGSDRAQPNRGR